MAPVVPEEEPRGSTSSHPPENAIKSVFTRFLSCFENSEEDVEKRRDHEAAIIEELRPSVKPHVPKYKVVIFGGVGVGKSSVTRRLTAGVFSSQPSDEKVNLAGKLVTLVKDGVKYWLTLEFWDVPFRSGTGSALRGFQLENADALLLVCAPEEQGGATQQQGGETGGAGTRGGCSSNLIERQQKSVIASFETARDAANIDVGIASKGGDAFPPVIVVVENKCDVLQLLQQQQEQQQPRQLTVGLENGSSPNNSQGQSLEGGTGGGEAAAGTVYQGCLSPDGRGESNEVEALENINNKLDPSALQLQQQQQHTKKAGDTQGGGVEEEGKEGGQGGGGSLASTATTTSRGGGGYGGGGKDATVARWCAGRGAVHVRVSARTGDGFECLLQALVRRLLEKPPLGGGDQPQQPQQG